VSERGLVSLSAKERENSAGGVKAQVTELPWGQEMEDSLEGETVLELVQEKELAAGFCLETVKDRR
jgi:hypothetical protein